MPDPVHDDRDRDPAGRARNARPRDEAGRPLPRSAVVDGIGHPATVPQKPERPSREKGRPLRHDDQAGEEPAGSALMGSLHFSFWTSSGP